MNNLNIFFSSSLLLFAFSFFFHFIFLSFFLFHCPKWQHFIGKEEIHKMTESVLTFLSFSILMKLPSNGINEMTKNIFMARSIFINWLYGSLGWRFYLIILCSFFFFIFIITIVPPSLFLCFYNCVSVRCLKRFKRSLLSLCLFSLFPKPTLFWLDKTAEHFIRAGRNFFFRLKQNKTGFQWKLQLK